MRLDAIHALSLGAGRQRKPLQSRRHRGRQRFPCQVAGGQLLLVLLKALADCPFLLHAGQGTCHQLAVLHLGTGLQRGHFDFMLALHTCQALHRLPAQGMTIGQRQQFVELLPEFSQHPQWPLQVAIRGRDVCVQTFYFARQRIVEATQYLVIGSSVQTAKGGLDHPVHNRLRDRGQSAVFV
ncbi:hypothetical protein D3C79_800920 [compost metagenome]